MPTGASTSSASTGPVYGSTMIASADGAASLDGRAGPLGGPADKEVFAVLRALADVVLVGAGTMRAEHYGPARLDQTARSRRSRWGLPAVPPIAVVTGSCRLDWGSPFFAQAEQPPVVLTAASAAAADRAHAAEVAEVIVAGEDEVDLTRALDALADRGHENVLAEGGPSIAAQLATAGLVDELCLTVSPLIAGGPAGRILDGATLVPPACLELDQVLEADGYLFLRYGRR